MNWIDFIGIGMNGEWVERGMCWYLVLEIADVQLGVGQRWLEDFDVRPLLLQSGPLGAQFHVLSLLVAHQLLICNEIKEFQSASVILDAIPSWRIRLITFHSTARRCRLSAFFGAQFLKRKTFKPHVGGLNILLIFWILAVL